MIDPDRLRNAYQTARRDLLTRRHPAGHWVGELSSSALSTATAVSALAMVRRHESGDRSRPERLGQLIARGLEYLAQTQNEDGGWGDTDKSVSNIATTTLVRAAFHLAQAADSHAGMLARAESYIQSQGGVPGLRKRYGKDKTFAVPILTNSALAGLVPWHQVSPLPFELACLPYRMLRFLRLPVVSYAVPALVSVGQARYFHGKPLNPITRLVRRLAVEKSLKTLQRMQPQSGGFLEATPLTSFVVMSLASIGRADHPVVRRGVDFLVASARDDGSWPIDANLATWNTTLAINALATSGEELGQLGCLEWLLSCQHRQTHPFTDARPGGWGWSDLSGAVPDADDTSGALLALAAIRKSNPQQQTERIDSAAAAGIRWLLDLQNADGGWPTFCRGWGKLPFDRSGADLTAHALRAVQAWKAVPNVWTDRARLMRARAATRRGLAYLAKWQRPDGSWVPLWFGNQYHPAEENPVYGTARVLLAYRDLGLLDGQPARRGLSWLAANRGPDGGWGGGSVTDRQQAAGSRQQAAGSGQLAVGSGQWAVPASDLRLPTSDLRRPSAVGPLPSATVEETAVALEALISAENGRWPQPAVTEGLAWLVGAIEAGRYRESSPIGFYFAKLWYYERLYPLIFTVSALGAAVRRWLPDAKADPKACHSGSGIWHPHIPPCAGGV